MHFIFKAVSHVAISIFFHPPLLVECTLVAGSAVHVLIKYVMPLR